jgi:outer membrane protein assembly factor BamB
MRSIVILALALTAVSTRADDPKPPAAWPQFRGPGGSGVAPDGVPFPAKFGPEQNVLWKTALPVGHSSPCVWGDRIFLTCFDPKLKSLETIALDRRTGAIVWRRPANAPAIETVHQISNPATATPATDGERVYVYFASRGLICYDFAGTEKWDLPLPMPKTMFGSGTSPVVAGDLVLLNAEYAPTATLFALDRRTGKVVWKKEHRGMREGYSTPVVWATDGGTEVVCLAPGRMTAYSLADGADRWYMTVNSTACTSPVVGGGRLFAATWMVGGEPADRVKLPTFDEMLKQYDKDGDGLISKAEFPADLSLLKRVDAGDIPGADVKVKLFFDMIDLNKDGKISRAEWALAEGFANRPVEHGLFAIKPGGRGDVSESHVTWREAKATPEVPSPLYYYGRVYQVRDGGIVSCLDAETGKMFYRERVGPGGAYFSSPVAGDGKVYAASHQGVVAVLEAGDTFKVLARNNLEEEIAATPALVEGVVYVRTEKHLYAFGAVGR